MRYARRIIAAAMPVFLTGMAFFLGGGCRSGTADIEIRDSQAVLSPLILGSASVFMRIKNKGNGSDRLIDARVNFPGSVTELHAFDDGKMKKTPKIDIPAAATVRLRPIGEHIMIYKMPRDIKAGARGSLTLVFEKSGEKEIPFELSETLSDASIGR